MASPKNRETVGGVTGTPRVSTCRVGAAIRSQILFSGVSDGMLVQIKHIVENHDGNKLKKFFEGLSGIGYE